jgi:hypothetical protein
MSNFPLPKPASRLKLSLLGLAVTFVALLPWWRNHNFLRDFYDYGLFINVNARLTEGQRPYVDFTTPAQSAAFLLNYVAELIGGGTYVGMTGGAAVVIILGGLGLTFMLARRLNAWAAALLVLAIVVGSASQHTIAFYNPIGVLAMALTVWAFAVAPLLRRETTGWHLVAAAGLILGGINKINFHLLACLMAFGWVVHAWVIQKATITRGGATLAFIALCGFILPISIEIAWTGASWQEWFYNIVELPLSARGARISLLFSPQLYLSTLHGYYGELRIPQVGLIGVLMPAIAVVAAWRRPGGNRTIGHRFILILAGLLGALAGAALLLTNNEIAYVTFAASLVIAVGLWLGLGNRPRGGWFVAGLLLPAVILAAAGFESAWIGQRSQFGHDLTPREQCPTGEQAGEAFHYLQKLHLPPGLVRSLAILSEWREQLPEAEKTQVYYGPGAEWLEHIWTTNKVKGLPLVAAAFATQRETDLLEKEVIAGDSFKHLVVMEAWDHWGLAVEEQLHHTAVKQYLGTTFTLYHKLPQGTLSALPLDFIGNRLGTNASSSRVVSAMPILSLGDGRNFLGTDQGEGRIDLDTPCQRISAEYVISRSEPGTPGSFAVTVAAYANYRQSLLPRWSATVTLPEGTDEVIVPTEQIDGSGLPVTFTVSVPSESAGKVRAGWRAFKLMHMPDREDQPPILFPSKFSLELIAPEAFAACMPESLHKVQFFLRGGIIQGDSLLIPGGTEAWIHLDGMYTDIRISAQVTENPGNEIPHIQIVYYKGGRLERFTPLQPAVNGSVDYNAWTPESGGWIGILSPTELKIAPIKVKIESATLR